MLTYYLYHTHTRTQKQITSKISNDVEDFIMLFYILRSYVANYAVGYLITRDLSVIKQ